jgi:hypothetical protein
MEIGFGQSAAVESLVRAIPTLEWDRVIPDLQQIPRVVVAHRRAG